MITFSYTLLKAGNVETGRQLFILILSPDLKRGITFAIFVYPKFSVKFIRSFKGFAIRSEEFLIIWGEMSSYPGVLDFPMVRIRFTSFSLVVTRYSRKK